MAPKALLPSELAFAMPSTIHDLPILGGATNTVRPSGMTPGTTYSRGGYTRRIKSVAVKAQSSGWSSVAALVMLHPGTCAKTPLRIVQARHQCPASHRTFSTQNLEPQDAYDLWLILHVGRFHSHDATIRCLAEASPTHYPEKCRKSICIYCLEARPRNLLHESRGLFLVQMSLPLPVTPGFKAADTPRCKRSN